MNRTRTRICLPPFCRGLAILAIVAIVVTVPATVSAAEVVRAVNVGGPAYENTDGVAYAAEAHVTGGKIRRLATLKGSQDPELYETYREGDGRAAIPLPDEIGGGERVFDTLIEERRVIGDLDIMASRDSKIRSALTVTVPDIEVRDGELSLHFDASVGEPVLSALVVRRAHVPVSSWELVWADEFDGDALDESKWSHDIWPARKVNDEDQAYTDRPKNIRVGDGLLTIEAHREDYGDARYTSARIHSAGKGDFLYGRFEVSAKRPRGMGTWAAAWMLPSDPFHMILNLAVGGMWGRVGGGIDDTVFPQRLLVDYVHSIVP